MKLLLDTHTFIWYVEDDARLPETTKEIIKSEENTILISIASLWEISIKTSLNKLTLKASIEEIINLIMENGFELLPILPSHIIKNNLLEYYHRDPFDRMIIAQGLSEEIVIVGKDEMFDKYDVTRIWK